MSINSMKTQCYQVTKKPCKYMAPHKTTGSSGGPWDCDQFFYRYYLTDNGGNLIIPIKDWKNMRCLYDYLLKEHKLYDRNNIKKIVQTANKSNGVFLLDNDDEEIEKPIETPKPVKKVEELLKIENARLKTKIDELKKRIIRTNQINTDLKL